MDSFQNWDRRRLLQLLASGAVSAVLAPGIGATSKALLQKAIPSSGATVPAIGLGSWITFNVGRDGEAIRRVTAIIRAFLDAGGRMIDSSPMYGSSQATIGAALKALGQPNQLIAVDKVWTDGASSGRRQLQTSLERWGVPRFDLLQVHNLVDWKTHLPILFEAKKRGDVGYVGVTTSHGRRHGELEQIMKSQPIDFVQLTYNMRYRSAERRLLPLALERGIAVIVNRPYDGGRLIRFAKKKQLPGWVPDAGVGSWAEYLLKFNVSHPAVTCAIPATSSVRHVKENMAACYGGLPDEQLRARMLQAFKEL